MMNRREFIAATASLASAYDSPDELTLMSLTEASELVRKKSVSPVELTEACLKRIEKLNPSLKAYITVTADEALSEARARESEQHRGRWRGPLHGIPIALKDNIDTAGIRTTAASAIFARRIPSEDAEAARRLKSAGAVLLGKLNMSEFAYSDLSTESHFGAVHNPWNPAYVAGGSSGGSAAAVAAGLCFGALGSDTGGSIRQPAAYCGIAGLKPTYGRVSNRGVIPLAWSLDHVGPMTRTAADTALLLQAIAGYDPDDPASENVPAPDYREALRTKTSSFRIGVPRQFFFESLDPEIASAVDEAIRILGKLAASVRELDLSAIKGVVPGSRIGEIFEPIFIAESHAYHAAHLSKHPELYQPPILHYLRTDLEWLQSRPEPSAVVYARAIHQLAQARRAIRHVFESVDLLVTPTTPSQAWSIEETRRESFVRMPGERRWISLRNTQPINVYGLPAVSIPCGLARKGLPVGLQVIGPAWGETNVLALAHAYQQATSWHKRRPVVS
jgi:aspartyl-tRNA(Asn)/glutamyl-tRNA(Gln) amidotransferase subunit A